MTPREFYNRWYNEARIIHTDEAHLLEWLEQQFPDDWHAIISNWNYDSNNAALKWIASHQECDIGTAIQLFMIGKDSWDGYKRKDIEAYYHNDFDTYEIARNRLMNEDFINRELIPNIRYSSEQIRPTDPSIIKTYKGLRAENSDFKSQDGTIYLSERAFAKKIGVDFSILQNSVTDKSSASQEKLYSKFQVIISIITLLTIFLALIFL